MEINVDTFWRNVQKEIKMQDTTQEWVAKELGVSIHTFNGWISRGTYPRVDQGFKIAVSLETTVEYLMTGSSGPRANKKVMDEIKYHAHHIQDHLDAIRLFADEVIE